MAAVNLGRGRGFALQPGQTAQLRRPGAPAVSSVTETFSQVLTIPKATTKSFEDICDRIVQMNLVANPDESSSCVGDIEELCTAEEDLKKFAETLLKYALMSKWNAHTIAIFVQNHKDIRVSSQDRLLTVLLRMLQALFEVRIGPSRLPNGQEAFHMEAIFMCEMFYHIRINDSCVKVLQPAIYDYFCMLVDGGTSKDVEVFVEQFPKCYQDLKELCMERLLCKLRKNIVAQISFEDRAKLLEMLELIVTDFKPLKENAIDFYHSINIPIVRLCSDSSAYSKS